ncbi:MAG: hypothetical protein AB1813_27655 [Verrucomicrobiota bacterium]
MHQGGDMQSLRIYPPANMKRSLVCALVASEILSFAFIVWVLIPAPMTVQSAMRDLRSESTLRSRILNACNHLPFVNVTNQPGNDARVLQAVRFLELNAVHAAAAAPQLLVL